MFTGIVQTTGTVTQFSPAAAQNGRLEIESPIFLESEPAGRVKIGDSVAVNGVCLTVAFLAGQRALFEIASETGRKTTIGGLKAGSVVNLEQALRFGDRLDGHLVQGHVDAVTQVTSVEPEGETKKITLKMIDDLRAMIAPKGSISIDGVSLTVGTVDRNGFSVYVIPHTERATILSGYKAGTKVNLEADCIARYVAQSVAALKESIR